jgi:hypothetical protein
VFGSNRLPVISERHHSGIQALRFGFVLLRRPKSTRLQRAYAEAFARLTPEQRRLLLQRMADYLDRVS